MPENSENHVASASPWTAEDAIRQGDWLPAHASDGTHVTPVIRIATGGWPAPQVDALENELKSFGFRPHRHVSDSLGPTLRLSGADEIERFHSLRRALAVEAGTRMAGPVSAGHAAPGPPPGVRLADIPAADGPAQIVRLEGRPAVVANIHGVNVPFYISSGRGEKTEVETGRWYPFFGIGGDGWLNKGRQDQINDFYGSPLLRQVAAWLDRTYGDISSDETIPELPVRDGPARATGPHIAVINRDIPYPIASTGQRPFFEHNVEHVCRRIEGGLKATFNPEASGGASGRASAPGPDPDQPAQARPAAKPGLSP